MSISPRPDALVELRVLLLQARRDPDMELQEQTCFLERTGLAPSQMRCLNLAHVELPADALAGVDALMIGGAGEFSATSEVPWFGALFELVRAAHEHSLPTFGSCWGHQVIARALGGQVIHDSSRAELGCFEVALTEAGREDPLFSRFPPRFDANMGHHDRVLVLPPGGVDLARSASQPHQAFRVADRPIYGTQFHSELDAARVRERLVRYRRHYPEMADDETFAGVMQNLRETTEVDQLLRHFLELAAGELSP